MKPLISECTKVDHIWPVNAHKQPVLPDQLAWVRCDYCGLQAPIVIFPYDYATLSRNEKIELRRSRVEQFMVDMRSFNYKLNSSKTKPGIK